MYPAYETVANLVVVIAVELRKFVDAYKTNQFYGVHDEMPQILDLIARAQDLQDSAFDDLDAVQSWLLDVAIVGPQLWD